MFAAYVTITILTSIFTGFAAATYLLGHAYPKSQLEIKRLPQSWMPRLGGLLAVGSVGLLVGFVVPWIGALAAIGLVLYFVGAFVAHLRVGSRDLVGAAVFLSFALAALVLNLAHRSL